MAAVVAAIGGGVGYLLSLNPETGTQSSFMAWSVTGVLVGILFITYTSDHWLNR